MPPDLWEICPSWAFLMSPLISPASQWDGVFVARYGIRRREGEERAAKLWGLSSTILKGTSSVIDVTMKHGMHWRMHSHYHHYNFAKSLVLPHHLNHAASVVFRVGLSQKLEKSWSKTKILERQCNPSLVTITSVNLGQASGGFCILHLTNVSCNRSMDHSLHPTLFQFLGAGTQS